MFSVLILTLNEEKNLPAVFASIAGCDDVIVLDSGSTDQTAGLARAAGARVFVRAFDDFATQRNFAQRELAFRHPWVFHLDADERLNPALMAECRALGARNPEDLDGFYAAPKMLFQGKWLPRCTDFPAWQARFVHAPRFTFVQAGHGQRESPSMRMDFLQNNYEHEMLPGSEAAWLQKHRSYARQEARQVQTNASTSRLSGLFSRNRLIRRRTLKSLSHRLPFRPSARIFYQYVLRRGFLDGRYAWRYCRLLGRYEGFIDQELRPRKNARLREEAAR